MSDCKDLLNSVKYCLLPVFSPKRPCKVKHCILLNPLLFRPLTKEVSIHHQLLPAFIRDRLRFQALSHKFDDVDLHSSSTPLHMCKIDPLLQSCLVTYLVSKRSCKIAGPVCIIANGSARLEEGADCLMQSVDNHNTQLR